MKNAGLVIYAKDYKKLASFYAEVIHLETLERDHESINLEAEHFDLVILQSPYADKIALTGPPT